MKTFIFLIFVLFCQLTYSQSAYTYMGTFTSNGVPNYLDGRDNVSANFISRINASLPERFPVPSYNPQYIANGTQTNIELTQEADVWVTFVSEGAGYMNVLGYYTYNTSSPLTTPPNNRDIKIIFPNVSALGSGGGLVAGDRVKLGTFPAGTGIGWVLLANAWKGGLTGVGTPLWTLYSDKMFNPEAVDALKFHNVLLFDAETNRIVLGFEDIRRDYSSCDNDFNDAIFYITATPNTAISRANMNETVEVGFGLSSGNDGGLESNGTLAEKITLRNINKGLINKIPSSNTVFSSKNLFSASKTLDSKNPNALESYFPIIGNDSSTAYLSSPTDLIQITNAVEVLSADYYKIADRTGVVLATKTLTEVYSHSKSICDRVGGSSLESVKLIYILGKYPANLISLKKNNTIEYALCFSMRNVEANTFEYNSHWNIEDFPTGYMYINFQVWGKTPADVFFLVEEILNRFEMRQMIVGTHNYSPFPDVLMKTGSYSQGKFKFEIINPSRRTGTLRVAGTFRPSEMTSSKDYNQTVDLNGQTTQKFDLDTKGVFDAGLVIKLDGRSLSDNVYLADGAWIANFEQQNVSNAMLKIMPQDGIQTGTEKYWVERGFEAKGDVKNYYSVHRPLRLGLNPVDLSEYNYLTFTASGVGEIEIVISRNGIREWGEQARFKIRISQNARVYSVNLNNVVGVDGLPINKTDITALTFSAISDNISFIPFDFKFNQLAFIKTDDCEINKKVNSTAHSVEKYESVGTMSVKNVNKAESKVALSSTNAIEFLPGFSTEAGAVLKAEIKGCESIKF
ncbi:MAG: DUF4114 domain-containing protein [Emticicia sp.]|uniref:DUF4114 domain-containing protein n=1 Tax=Emticicia sp. TaxID=1930953 RepID=UPI003BA5151E